MDENSLQKLVISFDFSLSLTDSKIRKEDGARSLFTRGQNEMSQPDQKE